MLPPSAVKTIFCVVPVCHSRKLDEFAFFLAAHPMRNGQFLQANRETEFSHFVGDVFDGAFRLFRPGQTRSDIVGKIRRLR
jgi:hypothetical protein